MIAWLRSARGLATLLVVSLAVNLFLGGVLAGRFTSKVVQESQTRRSIQAMLAPLPDAQRELVRREIGKAMPAVRERFAALQRSRTALSEEMTKPSPDNAALERAFADVQVQSAAIGAELQKAIVRALPSLTQDERRAMVQALGRRQTGSALPLP